VLKLASNSVGGSGVGVKGLWFWPLAAVFAILLLVRAVADAQRPGEQSASADQPIAAEVAGEPVATIKMNDDEPMYQPSSLIIEAGQVVEWKNYGVVSHSVNDDPKKAQKPDDALLPPNADAFNSGNVMPGHSYRHIFLVPGRYRYFCLSHEADKMIGEIIVKPPPPSISRHHRFAFTRPPQPSVQSTKQFSSEPWRALEQYQSPSTTVDSNGK